MQIKENGMIDEILEMIWTKKEEGSVKREEILKNEEVKVTEELLEEMIGQDYLYEIKGEINLGEKGKERAHHLVRSHRLIERFFNDVLEMAEKFIEPNACTFEHILNPEVSEAICILLGHPHECPHGRPIPKGECCRNGKNGLESIVLPLSIFKSGEECKIMYISTRRHKKLDKLIGLGIIPGREVKVHQIRPSFIIKVGETDIALDREILSDIFVRRKP